ncbi:helix-turn-helix domain-containing protein [Lacinutrix neustonica]|uniref:Helix-turn-helix domain-containing protein n=1 Tax=Lacinutrix neustonica TaxID=2980107 RepID=A0A9E8MWB2_9FLAO|nr:helix-turn-helix domain-containing protein [Lacinutrix neustonica]WAC01797.1 helix-turn-helix domain-containing protein [Lacinutrix neustonica]
MISRNNIQKDLGATNITKVKSFDIADDVIKRILNELKDFENKNKFLRKDLSLNNLAKDFNTNSVYLSKIVNHYKGLSFSNYLNDLRLEYCLEQLNSNHQLRAYTIKAISSEVGFSNSESFSKAFYNKTGIKPSFYVTELNKLTRN